MARVTVSAPATRETPARRVTQPPACAMRADSDALAGVWSIVSAIARPSPRASTTRESPRLATCSFSCCSTGASSMAAQAVGEPPPLVAPPPLAAAPPPAAVAAAAAPAAATAATPRSAAGIRSSAVSHATTPVLPEDSASMPAAEETAWRRPLQAGMAALKPSR